MTIGFVSAGLLTFYQAFGVIIGANLGTTATGWIVSLLGFKLNIHLFALLMVGVGVLIKLLKGGRAGLYGYVITGFGLIFVGIEILQSGMENVAENINISDFSTGVTSNIILVLVGIVMTVIMQSSSAAVAMTITALYSEAIVLEQAMALVIGQNIGTTITATIGAIGGSLSAKRTALSHVFFNLITGLAALGMLPIFLKFISSVTDVFNLTEDSLVLALFHTTFNIFGVLLVVPFIKPISRIIFRILPEKEAPLTQHLDKASATYAPVALVAVRKTLIEIAIYVVKAIQLELTERKATEQFQKNMDIAEQSIEKTRMFINKIKSESASSIEYQSHLELLHAMDHMHRLIKAAKRNASIDMIEKNSTIHQISEELIKEMDLFIKQSKVNVNGVVNDLKHTSIEIAELRKKNREELLNMTASGQLEVDQGLTQIRALLWLDRIGYHLWRMAEHLQENRNIEENKNIEDEEELLANEEI